MHVEKYVKESFTVIGKMGSTKDGQGFISALWAAANAHFSEVAHLAKLNPAGSLVGIWGAMSDFSMSFLPWEANFNEGLYLAGVECTDGAEAPAGWVKWVIPGFEYLKVENDGSDTFARMIEYMKDNQIGLVGAVHDFTDPATGKGYMLFPVRSL